MAVTKYLVSSFSRLKRELTFHFAEKCQLKFASFHRKRLLKIPTRIYLHCLEPFDRFLRNLLQHMLYE
jgi:hypothetical protein